MKEPPVSPRKALPMSTYQQTLPLVDKTSEAGPNEQAAGRVTVQVATNDPARERNGITDSSTETMMPPRQDHRQFAYPAWPTSKPGPETTSPLSGQKPHPTRTDQMVYECYDQERGMPDVTPPTRVIRENGTRTYLPDAGLQEVDSEAEAMERWLDDGGIEAVNADSAYSKEPLALPQRKGQRIR